MLVSNNESREETNVNKWHEKGYTGKEIHVVVIDTLARPYKHMESWASTPLDHKHMDNHGSNVAQCVKEFAPGVRVTMVTSTKGGREWIKQNYETIDLINISLSSPYDLAVHSFGFLEAYDIPITCSSGNESENGELEEVIYPANFLWTVAVGAYNWRNKGVYPNKVTSYSNGGKNLIVVAPTNIYVKSSTGNEFSFGGTSASSPVMCGILACYAQFLKESGQKLTRKKAFDFIKENVLDLLEPGHDYTSGYGLIFLKEPKTIEKEIEKEMTQKFSDVGKSSAFYNDVQQLVERGVINGFSDGTFRPNETLTRGQVSIIVNRAINYVLKNKGE